MSTNKNARERLEAQYGKGCMFKKAHVEDQIERLKNIKTYKTFLKETRYTGKKIKLLERNMTYHHLRHVSEGGKATDENGAIVNELAHRYMHSLPREQEELINNMIRRYKEDHPKAQRVTLGEIIEDKSAIDIELDLSSIESLDFIPPKNYKRKVKYNRVKSKRETQDMIDDYLYGEEEDMSQLFECKSDEDVLRLYHQKQNKKQLLDRLRNMLRGQAMYIKDSIDLDVKDKLDQMSIVEQFVKFVDHYDEYTHLIETYQTPVYTQLDMKRIEQDDMGYRDDR